VRAIAALALLLVACETPPLTIRFVLTDGESQQCISANGGNPTTDCSDIDIVCDAVLSIRVVPPNEPEVPYISVCQALPRMGQRNLCSIAGVDLPPPKVPIPEQVLEVQMAVFPDKPGTIGVDSEGNLVCPIVQFGVNGLPVMDVDCSSAGAGTCAARPAVGGRAFYHPGDTETLIKLGCTELELLRGQQCTGLNRTTVIATVNEFEFPASVEKSVANRLSVAVGEPVPGGGGNYVLDVSRTHALTRDETVQFPYTWSQDFTDLGFTKSFCVEVLEDVPLATRTLRCRELPPTYPDELDGLGARLKPETLATILKAANLTAFPSTGLVVGIVLNASLSPVSGTTIQTTCPADVPMCPATVRYLSEDRLSLTAAGNMNDTTHSSGIFVSTDAPYGTYFNRAGQAATSVFGGIVDNKVTLVVIQETSIGGM
jgi:hypothetical protein